MQFGHHVGYHNLIGVFSIILHLGFTGCQAADSLLNRFDCQERWKRLQTTFCSKHSQYVLWSV